MGFDRVLGAVPTDDGRAAIVDVHGEARAVAAHFTAVGELDGRARRRGADVENGNANRPTRFAEFRARVELAKDRVGLLARGRHPERAVLGEADAVAEPLAIDDHDRHRLWDGHFQVLPRESHAMACDSRGKT